MSEAKQEWNIAPSHAAVGTINPIRNVVDKV